MILKFQEKKLNLKTAAQLHSFIRMVSVRYLYYYGYSWEKKIEKQNIYLYIFRNNNVL